MRIVGGKDYYDSASAYGIDPGIVFVRNGRHLTRGESGPLSGYYGADIVLKEDIEEPEDPPRNWVRQSAGVHDYWNRNSNVINGIHYAIVPRYVIFCGRVYRGVSITTKPSTFPYLPEETSHFWHHERLVKFAAERELVASSAYFRGENRSLEDCFRVTDLNEQEIQILIKLRAAIVTYKGGEETPTKANGVAYGYATAEYQNAKSGFVINADGLKDVGFQSAVDPVTAFQELAMFVGGTLSATNGPNVVTITDDKVKLAKHGMDHWSFRKKTENSKP